MIEMTDKQISTDRLRVEQESKQAKSFGLKTELFQSIKNQIQKLKTTLQKNASEAAFSKRGHRT